MKNIYGTLFKELRQNKGFSIKEITSSEVSSATISKFEHGIAMISLDKFFRLLSNINVSPGEFALYVEDKLEIPYSFSSVSNDIAVFEERGENIVRIQKMIKILKKQRNFCPNKKFLRIQIINLKAILSQTDPEYRKNISDVEIELIKHYLLGVSNWNEFELRTYCSTIHLFDFNTIRELTQKLLNPLNYRLMTSDIHWMTSVAIINLLDAILPQDLSVPQDQLEFFQKVIDYLDREPIPDRYTSEKAFIKFNIAIYRYSIGHKKEAIKEMKNIIKAMIIIGCGSYANSLILEFERITQLPYIKV